VRRFLLLHGGNPFDELIIAAAGAAFLIAGYIAIRLAPSPTAPDSETEPQTLEGVAAASEEREAPVSSGT
jgi:hypothetical protein